MKKILITRVMLVVPALAAAQVNKCLDASGKVVGYGAQCPAGTRSEQTTIRNSPGRAGTAQKSLAERDAEFRKRQMEKQESETKTAKSSADLAQRKRACEQSQEYLKNLQSGHRIRKNDPKTGERTFLDDADYPKEIARAQQNVSNFCK